MKQQSKRPAKRQNIAADFFADLRDEPIEIPSFITGHISDTSTAAKKPKTNTEQTRNKLVAASTNLERSLNGVGTESKRCSNGVETRATVSERSLNGVQTVSKRGPEHGLNGVQTVSERSLNGVENFNPATLIGREKQLLNFIFLECRRSGSLCTEPLTVERIREALEVTTDAVKTAIKRLTSKGLIQRSFRKNGRSGWVQYAIPKVVHEKLLYLETVSERSLNGVQTVSKRGPEWGSEQGLNAPSSSRDLYLNKTTTTEPPSNFNVTTVSELGITESAVARALELYPNIEPEKMQDLITRFAEFMRTGEGKRVQNARGFFISLAEQLSKGITPLDHIETPESRLMRELVAKKKAQIAEEERLETELRELDFEQWWTQTPRAELDALVQPNGVAPSGSESQKRLARQLHAEEFWPERKKKALTAAAGHDSVSAEPVG